MDSSEWVMYPNVYGMGLFSDGGVFSTKPYICGSAYFRKMMDFKKGEWCDILDGLYWRFIEKNKNFFLKNPRLSMMVRVLDKMKLERRKKIIDLANKFIEDNTTLSLWKKKIKRFVLLVKGLLSGERNGKGIGKMLNTVQKNALGLI